MQKQFRPLNDPVSLRPAGPGREEAEQIASA